MARFVVPGRYRAGLARLLGLDTKVQNDLLTTLSRHEPTASTNYLIERIVNEVEGIGPEDAEELVGAIIGIYLGFQVYEGITVPDVVRDILSSKDLAAPEDRYEHLYRYLVDVFSIEALEITTKAVNVNIDHEHTFGNARILTDVRPVFRGASAETEAQTPAGALIVHTLKLSYYQNGQLEDFYIALDTDDVNRLRDVLDRADSKARGLESMLSAAGVPYFGVETR